ncbi:Chitinase 2 [Marasmius sp. AFHP31]|nr:Chitinase 2 [Marasmius sp. AFHP31]
MCQGKGKIVTLSLGGDNKNNPGPITFSSDAQAEQFADTVWNLFLGGSSPSGRPFGNAVLDGIDLNLEGDVPSTGYVAFVNRIRSHADGASKKYYVTAAPQCPYPDKTLKPILDGASFDAVYVQFYNNRQCEVSSDGINFDEWDQWAKTVSPNKNVRVFLGAPASPDAAVEGYVDANTLGKLANRIKDQYSSFGGVMLWDASQADANGRYDVAIKKALTGETGVDSFPDTSATAQSTSAASLGSTAASSAQPSSRVTEAASTSESSVVASASSSSISDKSADNAHDGETRPQKASRFIRL